MESVIIFAFNTGCSCIPHKRSICLKPSCPACARAPHLLDAVGIVGKSLLVCSLELTHQPHDLSRTLLKQLQPHHLVHVPHAAYVRLRVRACMNVPVICRMLENDSSIISTCALVHADVCSWKLGRRPAADHFVSVRLVVERIAVHGHSL